VDSVTGQPCAKTETPLPGLYITKAVDKMSVSAGDTLAFTVTMTNTGNVDFTAHDPAVLSDNLASVLDDAAYNNDAAADADGDLGYADQTLTWSGALARGATVTVTYTVTVNDSKTGDDQLNNVASIPDGITPRYPDGQCPDGAASCDPPSPQAITVSAVSRQAPNPPLSYTGNDTAGQLEVAGLLFLFGLALLLIGRRRRRTT
jgi:fimbrial isopeptide formation D2 family protein